MPVPLNHEVMKKAKDLVAKWPDDGAQVFYANTIACLVKILHENDMTLLDLMEMVAVDLSQHS